MLGTVIVLRYVAAGNPRTNHFATARTNKWASKAARLMEVAMSGLRLEPDIKLKWVERSANDAVFQIYQPLEEPESEYILGQEIASPTKGQIYIRVLILIEETVC
jgi:hypothetical protein